MLYKVQKKSPVKPDKILTLKSLIFTSRIASRMTVFMIPLLGLKLFYDYNFKF